MLRSWKKCIVLSSALVFCFTSTGVHACYFEPDREDLRYMLFNPDLLQNKEWWSFFYSSRLHAFEGGRFETNDEDKLTAEWIATVGERTDTASAQACLFQSLPDSLLKTNLFYRQLEKRPALLRYFKLARRAEPLSALSSSSWEEQDETQLKCEYEDVTQAMEVALASESDPFLRKKYAFQLIKIGYYWGDVTGCHTLYSKYFKHSKQPGVLDWWAMHYISNYVADDSANYYRALVFSHSSAKMAVSKAWFSSKNFTKVLALAANNQERADVYVLRESINPARSLEGIEKIHALAPQHALLPFLIGREINKLEDWLGTTQYINAPVSVRDYWGERPVMENWKRDREYLDQFTAALQRMRSVERAYPAYYHLALATLNLMQGNATKAAKHLEQVGSHDEAAAYQATVLRIVVIAQSEDLRQTLVQNKLGKLYGTLLDRRMDQFESMKILYSLSAYLRYSFANKGLITWAGLFDNYARNNFCYTCVTYGTFEYTLIGYLDKHASTQDLEFLIERYNAKDRNALEEALFRPFDHPYYFSDLLATKYLRQGDVDNALTTLQNVPDSFWFTFSNALDNLSTDPFTVNNALLTSGQTMASYNKREIVERLDTLLQEAEANPAARAHNYFLLGNAWYNFTQHAWFMLSYGRGSATPDESVYTVGYKKALQYYEYALAGENNPERRAQLLYMLSLLTERKDRKLMYARAYEEYETTAFYGRRNCLTTYDMVQKGGN